MGKNPYVSCLGIDDVYTSSVSSRPDRRFPFCHAQDHVVAQSRVRCAVSSDKSSVLFEDCYAMVIEGYPYSVFAVYEQGCDFVEQGKRGSACLSCLGVYGEKPVMRTAEQCVFIQQYDTVDHDGRLFVQIFEQGE